MRCLNCGITLSAFKKLTDSDFCSTEHRDQFYTEQQRLIRERLKSSRTRFDRLGRAGSEASGRARTDVAAPVAEAQAPAKIAAFLFAFPDLHDRSLCLQFLPQINPELAAANPPARKPRSVGRQFLLPLTPDFPWPRYNPGLLSCSSLELADSDGEIAYGSVFELSASVTFGFVPAAIALLRAPEMLTRPVRSVFKVRMVRPKAGVSFGPIHVSVPAREYCLPEFGYRNFIEIAPKECPLPEKILQSSPVEITTGLEISGSLRVRSGHGLRGLAFLDRAFKMRPRMGVLPVDLPITQQIPNEPLASTLSAIRPVEFGVAVQTQPARVDRFLRFRPRGPLDSNTPNYYVPAVTSAQTETQPDIPGLRAVQTQFSPVASEHPMRTHVLAAAGQFAEQIASNSALNFATGPVNPGYAPVGDCAPSLVDRFYRPRPRGPVFDDCLPSSHRLPAAENGFVSQPAICELAKPALAFQPSLSDRLFRVRPRNGVARAGIADLIPTTAPAGLTSPPATPTLTGLTGASPSLVTRMYRMRPGSGLNSGTPLFRLPSLATPATAVPTDLAIAKFHPARPQLSPVIEDRVLRLPPCSGVGLEITQSAESITAAPAWETQSPSRIGFVSSQKADFAPPLIDKPHQDKPKLGVPSASIANLIAAGPSAGQFLSEPAICSIGLTECKPNLVLRLYRFRPKLPVEGQTSPANLDVAPLDFAPGKPEFVPDWWDVVSGPKPIFVNRMYRMRLKQPAQDSETLSQPIRTKQLAVPDPEPVLATMPAPSESSAAPSFLDRLYRMRPKGGKAPAPATSTIPCNALEPRPHSGAPAAILQSVSKHWKSAPLSVKSIVATLPLLLMMMFAPLHTPSMADESNRFRQAIVRRAAIEQADDFGDGLGNWQGVEKWKRKPSGVMQPVGLGLFKPSLELRDYRMTFSAQIVKQALGFVVRAKDERNYQAIKFVTVKPGPLPTVAVDRYAVVDGKQVNHKQTTLPMTVTTDTVYQICLEVKDQSFTLMVQGKLVDFWSEERLKTGGAGFLSAKGEQALIQNIRISHQDDAIGKLFAALALNVQAINGSERRQ